MILFSEVYGSEHYVLVQSAMEARTQLIPFIAICFPVRQATESIINWTNVKNIRLKEAIESKAHSDQLLLRGAFSVMLYNVATFLEKESFLQETILFGSTALAMKACSDCHKNRELCQIALGRDEELSLQKSRFIDRERLLAACEDNEDDVRGYKASGIDELDRKHHGNNY